MKPREFMTFGALFYYSFPPFTAYSEKGVFSQV